MNFKSISLALLTLSIASVASAQTLFHDDWESYRPGTQDWDKTYSWNQLEYMLDAGERLPNVIAGAKDGITPFSGKQMFKLRGSVLNASRTHAVAIPKPRWDDFPVVEMSFRFAIASSYTAKTWLTFGLFGGTFGGNAFANGIVKFDTFKNTFRGVSSGDKALLLPRDTWNEFTSRIDWKTKKITLRLNGLSIDSVSFSFGQSQPPFRIDGAYFQVAPQQSYANQYPIDQGIPGMLLDDITMTAVPECSTLGCMALGASCLMLRRKPGHA